MTTWLHHIEVCDLIFYRAIGPHNRNVLFGGTNPLIDKNDSRLCQIPFGTKKATFGEVYKVCKQLSTVLVYGNYSNLIFYLIFNKIFYFTIDSKEIINSFIQNYVLKLFKKRKNKESSIKKIQISVIKPNENNSCEKPKENIQLSSSSGKYAIPLLYLSIYLV